MAHYTIFELERIEKVLQAKLYAAKEAYVDMEKKVRPHFEAENEGFNWQRLASEVISPMEAKEKAWELYKRENMDLMLLWGEVDLFERGINSLYSYWNYSVEVFIDTMRSRVEAKKNPVDVEKE